MNSPRDIFFKEVLEYTRKGEDIYVITVDFGCEALDLFRSEFPDRYINVGVAEQNAINVATGLALEGKKVFVYGIASFIVMRCYDQIRVNLDGMNLPVTIISVGADDEYKEAGFTHWSFEDLTVMKALENFYIYDIVDSNKTIPSIVNQCVTLSHPKYVRLRRK